MKWLIVLVIIGGVGGAVAWHFANREGAAPQYQPQEVTRGDIIQAVTATGSLNPLRMSLWAARFPAISKNCMRTGIRR